VELQVRLNDTVVGHIRDRRDGRNEFVFARDYLTAGRRPVLGQYFEDHLHDVHRSQTHLPPFFSALLAEGGLRELVARRAAVHPDREAALIAVLGKDLPGAVVVEPTTELDGDVANEPIVSAPAATALRFSLAGVQLKFSVLYRQAGRGPTLSVDGAGGTWIAKLPSETYFGVPEIEYLANRWARQVGIEVPEVALVSAGDLENLPIKLDARLKVFLSRRFDRPQDAPRIHQEDFAQVMNVRRDARYGTLGYGSLAKVIRSVAGEADFDEVVRRLAFNVVIGNGDAHLKNWSLTYPDEIHARLSPAYDLVPTVVYIPGDKLALKLSRETEFHEIGLGHFEKLAAWVEVEPARVVAIVRETVQRTMATWPAELDRDQGGRLRAHAERLLLVNQAG